MAKKFKKIGQNLFCSDLALEQAVVHSHQFLVNLAKVVDFKDLWRDKLLQTYKGGAEVGQPPYAPELLLKMLFLVYLFNITEREIERVANDSISIKYFLGLGLTDKAPDHSTIAKFKKRILDYNCMNGNNIFEEIFDDVIILAHEKGIKFGKIQAIDGTHTNANVNTIKEKKRCKKISDGGEGKKPRDPDAKWGVKRSVRLKDTNGQTVKINKSYFGYNNHLSVNTDTNMVTSFRVTPFNAYEGHSFKPLMDDDIRKGVAVAYKTIYTADKAYDDGDIHVWLEQARFFDAIDLKYTKNKDKTEKGKTKARWTRFTSQEIFEEGLSQRFVVERVNACLKRYCGLGRARYLGLAKMQIQTAMTCITHNLKTLVKQLTGVGLRTITTVHVSSAT